MSSGPLWSEEEIYLDLIDEMSPWSHQNRWTILVCLDADDVIALAKERRTSAGMARLKENADDFEDLPVPNNGILLKDQFEAPGLL